MPNCQCCEPVTRYTIHCIMYILIINIYLVRHVANKYSFLRIDTYTVQLANSKEKL